ncbi:hypothetical protein PPERSA_09417 [Pseudocohnilembus persalinus]|uniref:General transcription factor IIH subunit 4 n=1 Tax=Pseudocohnilembus persalinus TaxID=266149 RepID=A0A0V0Q9G1_PSEPJ|nr:hypothetical protein PPERSA_09417 [Pseudocohnilembus persalinus]|eukprot:KRW98892.1 hypothetical protein PPERSA_09417 [Pseudocohnilembus persalinus]
MQEKIKEAWLGLYNQINKFGQGTSNYNSENINNVIRKFSPQQQKLGFIMSSTKHQLHSFLDPNYYYQKPEGLSVLEKTIIEDLSQIRLIQKRQQNQNTQFCISELLHNFMLQDPQIKVGINCQIIVETNFMIYIEVDQDKRSSKKPSNDDINSVLDLIKDFCDIKVVFPHMIVAQLTQLSVLKAYKRKQMTSQLIIDFLNKWCSKKRIQYVQEKNKINKQFELRKKQGKMPLEFLKLFQEEYEMPLVPENVIQQLELWEFEQDIYNEEKLEQLGKKQQELDQEEDLETLKN